MLSQAETTGARRLIRCGVADETYCLDMSWVHSIQRSDQVRFKKTGTFPAAQGDNPDEDAVGWIPDSQGDIPVFSLANLLKRPLSSSAEEQNSLKRIIVLRPPATGESEARPSRALLVDRVSQAIQVSDDRIVPLPSLIVNMPGNSFQGVVRLAETIALLLQPDELDPNATPSTEEAVAAHSPTSEPGAGSLKSVRSNVPVTTKADAPAKVSRGRRSIMIFSTIAQQSKGQKISFGLSISQIPEILQPLPIVPVPRAPSFFLGLVNWRNRPVPVIDLGARLGLTSQVTTSANGHARLMIARGSGRNLLIGFPIQPEIRAQRLPIYHTHASRSLAIDQNLVRGIVELENETLVIPHIQELVA